MHDLPASRVSSLNRLNNMVSSKYKLEKQSILKGQRAVDMHYCSRMQSTQKECYSKLHKLIWNFKAKEVDCSYIPVNKNIII